MRITFLGTSSGAPTSQRNTSSFVLEFPQRSTIWMFDCGEGTQHQSLRARVKLSHLERVFVTHLHGDHVFGLPGLLASRSLQTSASQPLTLYGPAALEHLVRPVLAVTETRLSFPLEFAEAKEGARWIIDGYTVDCAPASHRTEAYAFAVQEPDRPGRFDIDRATALGVAPGPLFGRLKAGETVALPSGVTIDGRQFAGTPRKGRRVVYSGDTAFSPSIVELARGADVLIHEATYLSDEGELAARAGHSTAESAARTAAAAGARALILTHFSARYEGSRGSRMGDMLEEARRIFPNTMLANDLWAYDVPQSE